MRRFAVFAAIGLAVGALGLAGCARPGASGGTASGAARSSASAPVKPPGPFTAGADVDATAGSASLDLLDSMKFQPNVVRVKAGTAVNLELRNKGVVVHNFVAPGLGISTAIRVEGGQTGRASVSVPAAQGVYYYWCNEAGHAEAGMIGQIVVQP